MRNQLEQKNDGLPKASQRSVFFWLHFKTTLPLKAWKCCLTLKTRCLASKTPCIPVKYLTRELACSVTSYSRNSVANFS